MRKRFVPIAIGILIMSIMTWLQVTQIPFIMRLRERTENLFYDEVTKMNGSAKKTGDTRVIIVDIDEDSISKIGRWPWPRRDMIDLVGRIRKDGAAVMGFDVVFSEPDASPVDVLKDLTLKGNASDEEALNVLERLRPLVVSDKEFAELLRSGNGDTVLGFLIHNNLEMPMGKGRLPKAFAQLDKGKDYSLNSYDRYFASIDLLADAATLGGYMTALPDDDGVIRSAPLMLRLKDALYPSLALETAKAYLAYDKIDVEWIQNGEQLQVDHLRLGNQKIYTDAKSHVFIPYGKSAGQFPYVSASKVLNGEFPEGIFDGAVVLIGSSSFRFGDLHATPVLPTFPGVEIQATLVDMIISGQNLYAPSWSATAEIVVTVVLGITLAIVLPFMGTTGTVFVALFLLLFLSGIYFYLFSVLGIVFPVTGSMGQVFVNTTFNLGYGLIVENRRRRDLKNLFGQYVPKAHVELMSEHPEKYSAAGVSANLTVLFADIIGFTSTVQKLDAEEIRILLHQFLTPMTRIIFENQGTVDKYVGDMVMAFWGAPIADPHHAHHALSAALKMREEVERLKVEFRARGFPEIDIGIGINSGDMFVGDMGSEYRKAYTVLGDSVNVASRIESLTRGYGVTTLVGEATFNAQSLYAFRLIDRVKVVGRNKPLQIYELVALKSDLTKEKATEIERHELAMQSYFSKNWEKALVQFQQLMGDYPGCKIYPVFIDRIAQLMATTVAYDWDGAHQWLKK